MRTDRQDWGVTPAEVVLGTLRGDDRKEAARLMREDPAFRAEIERLWAVEAALVGLPGTERDEVPALDLTAALHARPPRRTAGDRVRSGAGAVLDAVPVPVLAGVAAVALFGGGLLAGGALSGTPDTRPSTVAREPSGRRVALAAFGETGPQRAAVLMPASTGGEMELRVADVRPSRPGEYYELWLLKGSRTTPIGTFRVEADGTARVRFPLAVDPGDYQFLDVSIQAADEGPAHSSRSVLRSASLT